MISTRVLKEFCNSSNIGLHYIPAYTPDSNPIEDPKKNALAFFLGS